MKKTLIASAVAAATLSTGAFAETAPVSISGEIAVTYANVEVGDNSTNNVQDNGSIIGFAHEHALSEDVTAFAAVDFEFAVDDGESHGTALDGLSVVDTAYVGVKGDFGQAIYGVDDTVYDWIDMVDTSEFAGLGGGIADTKDHEFIQYVSPEIAEGITLGATIPVESDATFAGALAVKYEMDNLAVAASYMMSRDEGDPAAGGQAGNDTIGLGVSFGMDEITILGQYEMEDDTADYFALQGMYTMGQNQFALGYGMTSFDNNALDDTSSIYVQALHNLSDNLYVYLEYLTESDKLNEDTGTQADEDTLALGATYSF